MPYPINQGAHKFNSIQSVPVSFGLWDTALKFLSPGPRNDVTDHLEQTECEKKCLNIRGITDLLILYIVIHWNAVVMSKRSRTHIHLTSHKGKNSTRVDTNHVILLQSSTNHNSSFRIQRTSEQLPNTS